LDGVAPQIGDVLLELGVFEVLPFFVDVLGVEVVLKRWDERRLDLFLFKVFPREVAQPGMVLDLSCTVVAQTVLRLALDHAVNEVSSFD